MCTRWTRSGGGMVVVIMVLMNMLYYYTQLFNIIDGWSEVRKLYCYPAMYLISADSAICMFKLPLGGFLKIIFLNFKLPMHMGVP